MDYLSIGHNIENGCDNGTCWYFKDRLLVEEKTNHSDWLGPEGFKNDNFACGRFDQRKKLISFVGYSISESRKEFIKKQLLKKFDGKVVEC
jgi:hypothetical protein